LYDKELIENCKQNNGNANGNENVEKEEESKPALDIFAKMMSEIDQFGLSCKNGDAIPAAQGSQ